MPFSPKERRRTEHRNTASKNLDRITALYRLSKDPEGRGGRRMRLAGGDHRLSIAEQTDSAAGYQATLVYYTPDAAAPIAGKESSEPLSIQLFHDGLRVLASITDEHFRGFTRLPVIGRARTGAQWIAAFALGSGEPVYGLGEKFGVDRETLRKALIESSACNWSLVTRPEERPMPWAEKDMAIVLAEADAVRMSVPLCGVVKEVIKAVKLQRNWPTPAPEG